MKIHSSGEHPTKPAEKINLLSEQPCRVLEQVEPFRRGITSRERKSLLPADDTRNGKTERATVLFSRAAEDQIGAVQNPGARAHVAKKIRWQTQNQNLNRAGCAHGWETLRKQSSGERTRIRWGTGNGRQHQNL
jgi:hypothetical protein